MRLRRDRAGALLLPLAIMFVAGVWVPWFDLMLRIADMPRTIIEYTRTGALYVSAAWLAIVLAAELGEAIIGSERLTIRSLDDQLVRLGVRLVGILAAAAILIRGGDELGFPAFSVLAGLGVGGLAVALAAQSTIANLIGSLLIALEKPFRVGQSVRIGGTEGTVEDVGFRSTRILIVGQFNRVDPQQYGRELDSGEPQRAHETPAALRGSDDRRHAAWEA